MKYIKKFEGRYTVNNINKKYYVWKKNGFYKDQNDVAILEVICAVNKKIYYNTIKQYLNAYRDFFKNEKEKKTYSDSILPYRKTYKAMLSWWKANMLSNLLFETNNLEDANIFFDLYTRGEEVTKDNFEYYKDMVKYNL